jgi:hypothetical protein
MQESSPTPVKNTSFFGRLIRFLFQWAARWFVKEQLEAVNAEERKRIEEQQKQQDAVVKSNPAGRDANIDRLHEHKL